MYPELFSIGPITIYSYGVLLAASYLLGLWLAMRRAQAVGPRREPRARPRHLHHHRGAGRREAAAAHRRLRSVQQLAGRSAVARAVGRRVLRRPDPRRRGRRSGTSRRTGCRSGRRATSSRRASRWATSPDGSAASRRAAATAGRPTCRGRSRSPTRSPRPTSARRSAFPLHPTQIYEAGAELLILGAAAGHRAPRPPFAGRTFWAVHVALRRLALHHRDLPRRSARRGVRVLHVAVHLARARRRSAS